MILNSLEMRNFKKYRNVKIEFQDGLTGIVGKNGSGKSTIVEAVAWALYGSKASTIRRDFVKNSRAGEREDVEVKLKLSLGRQTLTIFRAMKGKNLTPDARLFIDGGGLVATGTREVDQRLEEILKINFQDFMKTFYARQKDLDNLLKVGGTKKKEYLLTLLGLDDIRDELLKLMKTDRRGLDDETNRLEGALSTMEDAEEKVGDLERETARTKAELARARSAEASLASRVEDRQKVLEKEMDRKRSHEALSREITRLISALTEKREAIGREERKLEKIEKDRWRLYELKPKLARLDVVKKILEHLRPKRIRHHELLQSMTKIKTELEGELRLLQKMETRLETLVKDETELESLRPLVAERKELVGELASLEKLRDQERVHRSSLDKKKAGLDALDKNISRMESATDELVRNKERLEEVEPLREKYQELQIELARLRENKETQRRLDDLLKRGGEIRTGIGRISAKRSDLEEKILDLGDLEAEDNELRRREEDLRRQKDALNEELSRLRPKVEVQRSQRRDAERQLARIEDLGEESNCPTCERPLEDQYRFLVKKYKNISEAAGLEIEAQEEKIREMETRLDRAAAVKDELKKASDILVAKRNRWVELQTDMRSTEAQIVEKRGEAGKIEEDMKKIGPADYDSHRHQEIEAAAEELRPLAQEHAELSVRVAELPRWRAELEEEETRRKIVIEGIEELKLRIADLGFDETLYIEKRDRLTELDPAQERFSILEDKVEEIPSLEDAARKSRSEAELLQERAKELNEELDNLGFDPSEYEKLQGEESELRKAEETANQIKLALAAEADIRHHLKEASAAATRLESDLDEKRGRLADLDYDEEHLQAAKRSLDETSSMREEARKEVSSLQVRAGVLERDLEEARSKAERKKDIQKAIAEKKMKIEVVDTTRNLTDRFMNHILVKIRNEIAVNASQIMWEVTEKYSRLSIDEDFSILVEDEGEFYPISRYSGGEIDMIAVSVRVAISEYLMRFSRDGPGYSFLILDEIFGSQDAEHRESMIEVLRNLENRFPQILAISHIDEVQGQFDNAIQVIENDDGSSRVEVELI
ncbi:MAG: SMC family ATPase [Euryarchaeota archaeon]|nr:SMC family ATPase [Euryarchaeota archaeon]